jgi:hypothetical protein
MGLIERIFGVIFGSGRNVVRETAEVFRENAEGAAVRSAAMRTDALAQYGAEFDQLERGWFDRLVDGMNRLPRPLLAFGTLGLFVSAMVDPIWFAQRMQGVALVPEPLWWLLGAIVSFYFGARQQTKGQQFQREIAQTLARVPTVVRNIEDLEDAGSDDSETTGRSGIQTDVATRAIANGADSNAALEEWNKRREADIR